MWKNRWTIATLVVAATIWWFHPVNRPVIIIRHLKPYSPGKAIIQVKSTREGCREFYSRFVDNSWGWWNARLYRGMSRIPSKLSPYVPKPVANMVAGGRTLVGQDRAACGIDAHHNREVHFCNWGPSAIAVNRTIKQLQSDGWTVQIE